MGMPNKGTPEYWAENAKKGRAKANDPYNQLALSLAQARGARVTYDESGNAVMVDKNLGDIMAGMGKVITDMGGSAARAEKKADEAKSTATEAKKTANTAANKPTMTPEEVQRVLDKNNLWTDQDQRAYERKMAAIEAEQNRAKAKQAEQEAKLEQAKRDAEAAKAKQIELDRQCREALAKIQALGEQGLDNSDLLELQMAINTLTQTCGSLHDKVRSMESIASAIASIQRQLASLSPEVQAALDAGDFPSKDDLDALSRKLLDAQSELAKIRGLEKVDALDLESILYEGDLDGYATDDELAAVEASIGAFMSGVSEGVSSTVEV